MQQNMVLQLQQRVQQGGNKMKTQDELDDMSMIELVEEFIATCDRVIERNNSGNAV